MGENRFIQAAVPKMPDLACIGYVDEVQEPKPSKSGVYIVHPVHIQKSQAGRAVTNYILYRPEMFKRGFDPSVYENVEGGKGMLMSYRKHIAARNRVTSLQAFSGSPEAFEGLQDRLLSLPEPTPEAIHGVFKEVFLGAAKSGAEVGYVLTQGTEDSGEVDANGKKIYSLTDRYEIQRFFHPTADAVKSVQMRAKRSNGDFIVTFE